MLQVLFLLLMSSGIPVAIQVNFENDLSEDFTIIDVFAQDRPGLLYTITRTLSQHGLAIERAKISTEGGRAIASFYVGKITAPERLNEIREHLEEPSAADTRSVILRTSRHVSNEPPTWRTLVVCGLTLVRLR